MSDSSSADTSSVIVPPRIQQDFPAYVELIMQSESMDEGERQYWIDILPIMNEEQLNQLKDILEKERAQLAAIEKQYSGESQEEDGTRSLEEISLERERRARERLKKEAEVRKREKGRAEDILKEIE